MLAVRDSVVCPRFLPQAVKTEDWSSVPPGSGQFALESDDGLTIPTLPGTGYARATSVHATCAPATRAIHSRSHSVARIDTPGSDLNSPGNRCTGRIPAVPANSGSR